MTNTFHDQRKKNLENIARGHLVKLLCLVFAHFVGVYFSMFTQTYQLLNSEPFCGIYSALAPHFAWLMLQNAENELQAINISLRV